MTKAMAPPMKGPMIGTRSVTPTITPIVAALGILKSKQHTKVAIPIKDDTVSCPLMKPKKFSCKRWATCKILFATLLLKHE